MEELHVHKNTFQGGLNGDYDPNIIDPSQYIDAANVTLVPSGKFLALQNIAGTTNIQSLGIANTSIMAVIASRYTIGATSNLPCLTVFAADAVNGINIYCYDITNAVLYRLYNASMPSDYLTIGSGTVDGVIYPEKGQDIIYFTDNYYEVRKIRCIIPAGYNFGVSPLLTDTNMAVARRRAIGQVNFVSTASGGTLLTGTYQLAYQLINLNTTGQNPYNKYTRFSLLTTPIHIYYNPAGPPYATVTSFAGIGMISDQLINVNITPTADELANYTHFRLAIVENVQPEGAAALYAAVTEIQPISSYLVGSVITGYQIKNNYQNNSITIDEIVIDTAAIDHCKTVNVKNNRLFEGNLTYKNLTYNNGTPIVTSGSIIRQTPADLTANSFTKQDFATQYKGYFREEVYRYAISYFDKWGNFSSPLPLDMSTVTGNQSNAALGASNNALVNPTFSGGLVGWSQTVAGSTWVAGASLADNTGVGGTSSNILYQAAPATQGGYLLTLNYNVVVSAGLGGTLFFAFLNNSFAVIGTPTTIITAAGGATPSGTFSTLVQSPVGAAYVGFYTTTGAAANFRVQISSLYLAPGFFDMKFPYRSQKIGGNTYALFNPNGCLQSLGLQLNGIDHHPTWAQGFVILRAQRKKNILFQTPLIPMMNVYGLGPIDNYPTIAQEGVTPANVIYTSGTSTANATGLQASPPGPINVLYPMNLGWPKKRSINKVVADGGAALNAFRAGEAQLVHDSNLTHAQIFPQGSLYSQNHPYVYSTSHQVETVDAVVSTMTIITFGTNANGATTWLNGSGDTSVSMSHGSIRDGDYYYDSANSGSKTALRTTFNTMAGYSMFANGSPGTTLNGKFVMTTDLLETRGVTFGWKPYVQKSAVIELANNATVINDAITLSFTNGSPIASTASEASTSDIYTDFATTTQKTNTIEIVNITAGLTDGRYGSSGNLLSYIFTGVQYNFTTSELVTVAAGGSLPKNVSVFGGDCFVSTFNFKLTDTIYSITNQEKYRSTPAGITSAVAISKWGRDWMNLTGPAVISVPIALRNAAQYLTIILESEYNGTIPDFDTADLQTSLGFTFYNALKEYKCRSPLVYPYNYNLNKEDDQKLFIPIDPLNPVLTTLKSRIAYSNIKIYNTPTDGFDTIPVLNYYDMPEAYGSLTKLAIAGNEMYSVQQRGIAYLPIGNRVLETSDASNIQVHSGDVINIPVWIDIKRGAQQLRAVKETGTLIYIMDNENQSIYKLQGQSLVHISDKGLMSKSRTLFNALIPEQNIIINHDILRNEIWFVNNGSNPWCYVWNENMSKWISNYSFAQGNMQGGLFLNNKLYLFGQGTDNNQASIHTMYTGSPGQLMGSYVTPYVTFIVNPSSDFGKTFDDILINSTDRLASLSTVINRESFLGDQTATVLSLNVVTRGEGNYRAKILRDNSSGARLRGGKANHTLTWNSGGGFPNPVTVTSSLTQWRPSYKQY